MGVKMSRRYRVTDFLNEESEQVDEFFIRSMKKRPKPKYDDDDFVPDQKEVDTNDLVSFDKKRVQKIEQAISAWARTYTTNSKRKMDTIHLHFKPTVNSSLEKVKKQLEKLKKVLKIEDIRGHLNLIIITLKNQHNYSNA